MSGSSFLLWACLLQQTPGAPPPDAPPAKEVRGVIVEVFTDGLVLVSVGDDDYAEKGDQFFLARGAGLATASVASAEIVSLGKRFSVAKIKTSAAGITTNVGDRVSLPTWKLRQELLEANAQRGGAIFINGK